MYSTTTHSGTVDVGSSIYAMKNFTAKGIWENVWFLIVPCCSLTPAFKDALPTPASQLQQCMPDIQRQKCSRVLQGAGWLLCPECLDFFPNFSVHEISTATLVSHHFHLFWSLKPTGGCTLCIFPWRTQEARNSLCTLAASWRKKQSAPPSRQHELNSMA